MQIVRSGAAQPAGLAAVTGMLASLGSQLSRQSGTATTGRSSSGVIGARKNPSGGGAEKGWMTAERGGGVTNSDAGSRKRSRSSGGGGAMQVRTESDTAEVEDASWRCDMHPAFSRDYQWVAINGRPGGGERQVVVMHIGNKSLEDYFPIEEESLVSNLE